MEVRLPWRRRAARTTRLTGRGKWMLAVGAASIVAAYLAHRPELLYLGSLTALLPVIAVAFARFRRLRLDVARSFAPEILSVGEPGRVDVEIVNLAPTPTPELEWTDTRPWTARTARPRYLTALTARRGRLVVPGNTTTVAYELTAPRRGIFEIGPLRVVIADPFGFATGQVSVGERDLLVVTPDVRELPDTGLAILSSDGASMLVRRAIGGDDDLSTREYRTGDAMRRVHWKATARHGELMVRQEEPRSHAEARVILDTRRSGFADADLFRHRDEPESDPFEFALALAASVALHLARGGFAVEFVETAQRQLAPVVPVASFLRTLATIELSESTGATGGGLAADPSSNRNRARGSVFAVVSDADPATLEHLVSQRAGFDLAVAFIVHARHPLALEALSNAGWTCVPVGLDDTPEGAWRAVALAHGARHAR
ncbi:MAG: DUF58 domain-containing protein [Burkholderiaceae bacterium]|nr:DUF58 domain-containing protein [Microbacteriaceae bacterium]